jgi:glycosyltransferase involved in cell wall biosynthesis
VTFGLRLALVGPLPPPAGGMANQTRQLATLLTAEGVAVEVVRTNAPYRPAWVGRLRFVRAPFRLAQHLVELRRAIRAADVVHVMANSGTAWFLFAEPALRMARRYRVPAIVNYRGGLAREFLAKRGGHVAPLLRSAAAVVVPSRFLQDVFATHDVRARIVPNVVDLSLFCAADAGSSGAPPHVVVTRNLESIYGIDTGLRALARLRERTPGLRVSIAGDGPDRAMLERLATELGLAACVRFTGRLSPAEIAALYRSADLVLNPSRVDNTPNALIEAMACGVPIVSTDAGGIPFLVTHGRTAWLARVDDVQGLADGMARVLDDEPLRSSLRANGLEQARSCGWGVVRTQWLELYRAAAAGALEHVGARA